MDEKEIKVMYFHGAPKNLVAHLNLFASREDVHVIDTKALTKDGSVGVVEVQYIEVNDG